MYIEELRIINYKKFKDLRVRFNKDINIIVGDNESGKSTILEAVNLALTFQINGKSIVNEMTAHLFNNDIVNDYVTKLKNNENPLLPQITIELYLKECAETIKYKGSINSLGLDKPGITLSIKFDDAYMEEYQEYIKEVNKINTIPIEYYTVEWLSFSNKPITSRTLPIKNTTIDTANIIGMNYADKYILKIINDTLNVKQKVDLSINYRNLKSLFSTTETMKSINEEIVKQHGNITHKKLSIAMDVSSKSSWEANVTSYLDEIPFAYVGKGEQNTIKTMISLNKNNDCHVILIEEPENHLSFSNMTKLISDISTACSEKQLIITTHSTFVLNKLGVKNVLILCNDIITPLSDLSVDTQKYFQKLPGFNTLRILLSKNPILVEGPADDLVLQKAYLLKNNKLPLDDGIDIIVMNGLAFKRFLDIAMLVNKKIKIIRDNDGKDIQKIEANYKKYMEGGNLEIYCDSDPSANTLEPQLLKYNNISTLNKIFGQDCKTNEEILDYMKQNKTECALKIFETTEKINIPEYITNAIK